jgi:hypothetical protein
MSKSDSTGFEFILEIDDEVDVDDTLALYYNLESITSPMANKNFVNICNGDVIIEIIYDSDQYVMKNNGSIYYDLKELINELTNERVFGSHNAEYLQNLRDKAYNKLARLLDTDDVSKLQDVIYMLNALMEE